MTEGIDKYYKDLATGATYEDAIAAGRIALGTDFQYVLVTERDLTGFDLSWLDWSHAEFITCTLDRADFTGCILDAAVLSNTGTSNGACFDDVRSADGFYANESPMVGATFRRANLQGASFENTDCTQAVFIDADLRGTDFTDATLYGAKFNGAIIDETTVFTGAHRDFVEEQV